jgi:hypothetical protein
LKKIQPEDLPTQEEQDLKKAEFAYKFEQINKVITLPGWKFIKEILRAKAKDDELEKILSEKAPSNFEKAGQLVWLERQAVKKVEA